MDTEIWAMAFTPGSRSLGSDHRLRLAGRRVDADSVYRRIICLLDAEDPDIDAL